MVFTEWHRAVQRDLMTLESIHGQDDLRKSLQGSLGAPEVDRVFSNQMQQLNQARQQGRVSIPRPVQAGVAAAAAIPVPRNTFYGRS